MNDYEGLFIIKPDLKEEEVKSAFKAIGDSITKLAGSVNKEESWGKRQLAYPIKPFKEGYYYKVDFTAEAASVSKLEAGYKLNAEILRVMITRR